MENKNKYLIGGIIATALAIGLLESGAIQLSGSFLYGDENDISLILKNGEDTFIIEPGEKIIINDSLYIYKSVDVASQTLLVENTSIPLSDISTIRYVTGTQMKQRGLKGLMTGGMVGAAVGAVLGSVDGEFHYLFLTVPMCTVIDGAVLGIVGAGIGSTKKNSQAYALGENDWKIENQ
ncbi:MAG: hypothetical protein HOG73_05065 [Candidatus Marinimicrobia bacterium]|jgi:hypothetical protein|nr:hypothetical protein [Candidatus Neomarinimicrobiota bacterium]MBT5362637.1 hypothetical protein [Candidatus Neomarinimicrobiota bacterium]MBT5461581.1 hypothetical protein [Candidatus Neomarinimicrobiota bacterium]MBT5995069.1 hypothetical protein [Candidatus Neomarinimicrobiota bacterium]MBT6930193.1 hypothetical protein [Candidatus Neomarinimicrobiota bacterium]